MCQQLDEEVREIHWLGGFFFFISTGEVSAQDQSAKVTFGAE